MSDSLPPDVEKVPSIEKRNSSTENVASDFPEESQVTYQKTSAWKRFKDSFKEFEASEFHTAGLSEVDIAALATAKSPLKRGLKARHLQMIAIGGSIGTGLFVGSGGALSDGGPAAVFISYTLTGAMLFCTVHALGELAVRFPVAGAFSTYSTRFIDHSWGFAMGWNYALQWLVVFPLELVAASVTINYWHLINPSDKVAATNHDAWIAIFYVLVSVINIFGVRGYGEAEFVFSIIKVIAVIGFIILGIVLTCGGGPEGGYIGGKYWHDPGAFAAGFKGVVSVFVNAAFAFGGTELAGLAAAETQNPRKMLPSAIKQVFWRITLFYIVALLIVGFLVPYTDPRLLSTSSVDVSASPFVIAIENAGISGLPSVMNCVILISVLSVGNSSVFGCSRTLAALAAQKMAPKWMGYIDRQGRPLFSILVTLAFGLLCFVAASPKQGDVFNWLLAFSGMSSLFTWGSINLCHIRFRRAMKVQGVSTDQLPFKAALGIWGSWFGFLINALLIILQFWVALWPLGGSPDASDFFQVYLSVPVVIFMFVAHKLYYRQPIIHCRNMDIVTGMREYDADLLQQEIAEEKAYIASKGWWYRLYKWWC